ncbi:hypothetical protein F2Q70_00017764 [Brassica cretica]|uniref:Uncharacterized protein n=1 Tax=Brassica cretica TaxID=69181 RepID=A0A8S9I1P5_BRACR|nr:hypothetical protein F2Q70_00017764 [Brassica cretica]
MNSDFPASLVGGRVRPCRLFADPSSSLVASSGEVSETDNEAIPMAPSKRHGSLVLDDGPRSEIQEGGLKVIQRKYRIHSSVQMRSSLEFERAPDGGPGKIAIFEAYLIASFRGVVPSLVAEVSSLLGFCPSQLTHLSWKTLMSIQVLGELYGLDTGVHEVLYSYYFAPLTIMPGFYHLQPRDGAPLVEEPSRGIRGNYPFGENWTSRYVFMKIQEPFHYPTFLRTVDVSRLVSFLGEAVAKKMLAIPRRFRGVHFLMSKEVLRHSRLWDNLLLLGPSLVESRLGRAGMRRKRPFYAPPPCLTRATLPAVRTRPLPSRTATGDAPLMGVRIERWDPEQEYRRHLLCSEGSDHHFGGCPQVGSRSAAESRVSASPPF